MGKYNISIKKSAAKEIENIGTKKGRLTVINKIHCLADKPRCEESVKLTNQEKYRIRQGNYRILYQIFVPQYKSWLLKLEKEVRFTVISNKTYFTCILA